MVSLFARVSRHVSLRHIRHVPAVPPAAATGLVLRVYAQLESDFGMIAPPVALHAPAPECLAASWLVLRETLLVTTAVPRPDKEAVAAAVSLANQCPYCVEVHGTALAGLLRQPDADAVMAGRLDAVGDARLRALAGWARGTGGSRSDGPSPPFPAEQAPEILGTAVAFHYFNRMVNVFLQDSPLPRAPGPAAALVRRTATRLMGRLAGRGVRAGAALPLLPAAPLPDDLSWAAPSPTIAAAWARAAAAIEAAGHRSVPEPVRRLVLARLAAGTAAPPLGTVAWLDAAVTELPERYRSAGRLALLTALAAYRVTPGLVAAYRAQDQGDRALIELTSWASFTAARRVGAALQNDLARSAES